MLNNGEKKFKVQAAGRAGLIYSEGRKSICIDSEMLVGPDFDIVIYRGSVKYWHTPDGLEIVAEEEKDTILNNVKEDLEEMGYKVDFE